ncbi:hypothetical protein F7725_000389 [Dissostichus mawsoni]|uniref:Uncharacterized protein n=1 Tax=Dissostichus mawsoni TaxID=36200 RepID=A0A7J5ZE94_DISMA|nr:hypothetical protein F7725_000389 [Dissostichus mawsoni]
MDKIPRQCMAQEYLAPTSNDSPRDWFTAVPIYKTDCSQQIITSSLVAPFWRELNDEEIVHLVSTEKMFLVSEQRLKAVRMFSDCLKNTKCLHAFTESVHIAWETLTKVLEVSHTAANIAERLGEVMEEFGIPPEKRVAVVHDNAANMVLCAQQLSQNPSWEPGTTHRSDRDLDLTTAQWRIAEDIVSVLRPMITLTELLSQDVNASLSATLPMLVNMKRRHLLSRDDDSTTVKAVKKKITEEIDKRWELTGSLEGSIYIQAAVLDPRFKSLSFLDAEKRDDAYATVSDLAESLSPAEEATAQREDSSGTEESEPAPKRQREKQQDISMLMAFDEDQETEDPKKEMKTYLEDRTKDHSPTAVLPSPAATSSPLQPDYTPHTLSTNKPFFNTLPCPAFGSSQIPQQALAQLERTDHAALLYVELALEQLLRPQTPESTTCRSSAVD